MYAPLLSYLTAHVRYTTIRTEEARVAYRAAELALSAVWDEEPAIRRAAAKFGVEVIGEDRLDGTPRFYFAVTPVFCEVKRRHKADAIMCFARAAQCEELAENAAAKYREASVAYWRKSAQAWRDSADEWCSMNVVA